MSEFAFVLGIAGLLTMLIGILWLLR